MRAVLEAVMRSGVSQTIFLENDAGTSFVLPGMNEHRVLIASLVRHGQVGAHLRSSQQRRRAFGSCCHLCIGAVGRLVIVHQVPMAYSSGDLRQTSNALFVWRAIFEQILGISQIKFKVCLAWRSALCASTSFACSSFGVSELKRRSTA